MHNVHHIFPWGSTKKKLVFFRIVSGIPKLYVKLWWPLFLAMKFTFIPKFGQNSHFYS